jgi:hypothetical protein
VVLAVFKENDQIKVIKASTSTHLQNLYRIRGYPRLGRVSRGVLVQFVEGFEPKRRKKRSGR